MLADPDFCDMVHSIGVASLCADDSQIWHLTKIYWFTVEFGVVLEGDEKKAFGAGETQSYTCAKSILLIFQDIQHCDGEVVHF
jgi:phenylalanine-4-hydroxylase